MKPIQLYPHNQTAFENLTAMLTSEGRAAVIQPTGTGKSFIALALMEHNPTSTFLYLAPSTYIFGQLHRHAEDDLEQTTMLTYQKLCRMSTEEIMALHADYIILDEFHRCGADEWGNAVRVLLSHAEQAILVGFTATPIRYLDQAGVRDMAEELFVESVANYYSLRQAMADGVLPVPQYILCDILMEDKVKVRETMLFQQMDNRQDYDAAARLLEDMRRNLTQAIGTEQIFTQYLPSTHAKLIVFCRNLNHIDQAQSDMLHWLRAIAPVRCYSCRSDDGEADTELLAFINDSYEDAIRLLFCVDMLNEGLHICDVDGIVMLRPTASPTVYLQQIGRCLASHPDSNTHPVIFDLVNNHRSARIEGRDDILHRVNSTFVSRQTHKEVGACPFVLDSQVAQFDQLLNKFDHLLGRDGRWIYLFSILQDYVRQYGIYPRHKESYRGVAVGYWLTHQIEFLNAGLLAPERRDALEQLPHWADYLRARPDRRGVDVVQRKRWFESLESLKDYLQHHNNCYPISEECALYTWCRRYALRYRQDNLPEEMRAALERLPGWSDYALGAAQIKKKQRQNASVATVAKMLAAYTAEHGGQNPPASVVVDGFPLGKRINAYRQRKKKGLLPPEHQLQLEEAGIIWVMREKAPAIPFETYYEELRRYYAREGHIMVPQSYVTADTQCKLGIFVQRMRLARKGKQGYPITPQQIQMLDVLGMVWNIPRRIIKQRSETAYEPSDTPPSL